MAVRSIVALAVAGGAVEAGCLWILLWSPSLTALYTPDFTGEFFRRAPLMQTYFASATLDARTMVVVLEIGLCTMIAGYLLAIGTLTRPSRCGSGRVIVGFAVLFRTTLLLLPGLFSTDIFSYVMSGRIAAVHSANPYVVVPADFPGDPFLSWVFPFWRDTPSVYGPVWTGLSWVLSTFSGAWSNFDQVVVYRLTLCILELVMLALMWRLLSSSMTPDAKVAFCVFAWNPLVLFDLVGNAHNDSVMVLLMLAGVYLAARQHPRAGLATLTLSALVKFTTAVALLLWTVAWLGAARALSSRAARLAIATSIVVGLTVLLAWPWLQTGALASLQESSGGRVTLNSAPDVVALVVAHDMLARSGMPPDVAEATARMWIRVFLRGAVAIYVTWEIVLMWRRSQADPHTVLITTIRAATRVLLVLPLVLLSSVWSWYFSWSLALAVLLGWRSWLTRLVVLYTLVNLPLVYVQQYLNTDAPAGLAVVSAAGPLVLWAAWRQVAAATSTGRRLPLSSP